MPTESQGSYGVLFIGSGADEHTSLRRIFDASPCKFQSSFTAREGLDVLRRNRGGTFSVVICEQNLPDGDWKYVLAELDKMPCRASLIVSSRLADERLWAEVLNLGAFDLVLGDPFEPKEVLHVTESAWRASKANHEVETLSRMDKALSETEGSRWQTARSAA